MQIRINPETGILEGVNGGVPRTWAEIQQVKPPCPRCGTRISVVAFPYESGEGSGLTQLYQFGRHQFNCDCWNGGE